MTAPRPAPRDPDDRPTGTWLLKPNATPPHFCNQPPLDLTDRDAIWRCNTCGRIWLGNYGDWRTIAQHQARRLVRKARRK